MVDVEQDRLLSLKEIAAAKGLPLRRGRKTLWQWATRGARIDGKLRLLPTRKYGRSHFTTLEIVRAFMNLVKPTIEPPAMPPPGVVWIDEELPFIDPALYAEVLKIREARRTA